MIETLRAVRLAVIRSTQSLADCISKYWEYPEELPHGFHSKISLLASSFDLLMFARLNRVAQLIKCPKLGNLGVLSSCSMVS